MAESDILVFLAYDGYYRTGPITYAMLSGGSFNRVTILVINVTYR